MYVKTPIGVADRDLLLRRIRFKDYGDWDYVMVAESISDPNFGERKGVVRA